LTDKLNHFDSDGNAVMVDISEKNPTSRMARAQGVIAVSRAVFDTIKAGTCKKGDVLSVARIGGIMAVKRTAQIIPLCHTILITNCAVDFSCDDEKNEITAVCTVKTEGRTGAEMEALTGVSASLLTIYDMCKAIDRSMVIKNIRLCEKSGGKSGHFLFEGKNNAD